MGVLGGWAFSYERGTPVGAKVGGGDVEGALDLPGGGSSHR